MLGWVSEPSRGKGAGGLDQKRFDRCAAESVGWVGFINPAKSAPRCWVDEANPAYAGRWAASAQRAAMNSSISSALRASSRSEEHTSERQSLMRISYAVFCWKKKKEI